MALDHFDEVISLIRASNTGAEARDALMARFGLTEVQSQSILDMRLQRLVGLEREKLHGEFNELQTDHRPPGSILGDEKLLWREIKKEIRDIRDRYGDERRSTIVLLEDDINREDLIAVEDMVITMTRAGYLKRTTMAPTALRPGWTGFQRRQTARRGHQYPRVRGQHPRLSAVLHRPGPRLPREDLRPAGSGPRRQGHAHPQPVAQPCAKREHRQRAEREGSFEEEGSFVFATRKGIVKKTQITDYGNITSAA